MSVFSRIRDMIQKIPAPVRCAGEVVLDTLLPGGPGIVRLVKETVDWATKNEPAPTPSASPGDQQRVELMLGILQGQLEDVAEKVNRFPSTDQAKGYIRGCIINDEDIPAALRDLDGLAQQFDVLQASQRELLQQQHFSGELLQQLLVLTRRLVGVSDLASDLRAAHTSYPDFASSLDLFQAGAVAFSKGQLQGARQAFEKLKAVQPNLPTVAIAFDTVNAAGSPADSPLTASLVESILRRLPPPSTKKLSRDFPIRDEEVPTTFARHGELQELILWNCSNLTDTGLAALCSMLPRLTKLSLRKAYKITDRAIPAIRGLSQLQRLLLWKSQVTQRAANQLQPLNDLNIKS